MDEDEIDRLVDSIRERRLVAVLLHSQAVALKAKVKGEKLQEKITKFTTRIEKKLEKIDEFLDEFIGMTGQLKALRREALETEDIE